MSSTGAEPWAPRLIREKFGDQLQRLASEDEPLFPAPTPMSSLPSEYSSVVSYTPTPTPLVEEQAPVLHELRQNHNAVQKRSPPSSTSSENPEGKILGMKQSLDREFAFRPPFGPDSDRGLWEKFQVYLEQKEAVRKATNLPLNALWRPSPTPSIHRGKVGGVTNQSPVERQETPLVVAKGPTANGGNDDSTQDSDSDSSHEDADSESSPSDSEDDRKHRRHKSSRKCKHGKKHKKGFGRNHHNQELKKPHVSHKKRKRELHLELRDSVEPEEEKTPHGESGKKRKLNFPSFDFEAPVPQNKEAKEYL